MYTEELIKRIAKKNEIENSKFNIDELVIGMEVELEQGSNNLTTDITGDDPEATFKIVMAHMNESPNYYTKLKGIEKKELSNEAKRFMALSGIKEDDKKFLKNESFKEKTEEVEKEEDDFITLEFNQIEFEPGDEDVLYKIKLDKKEDI